MVKQSLDGCWQLARREAAAGPPEQGITGGWMEAAVPGEIHYDLERAGLLTGIFRSKAAAESATWVADADWVYKREFDCDPELLALPRVYLNLDSVDTYSDIYVNGELVGSTDNMFLRYDLPLGSGLLREKGNTVAIHIKAHRRMVADRADESAAVSSVNEDFARSRSLIRRYQRSWSTDLMGFGLYVLGIGIPRSVYLTGLPAVSIRDFHFQVLTATEEQAELRLEAWLSEPAPGASVECILRDAEGAEAARFTAGADGGCARHDFTLASPKLWWPNRFRSGPYLYTLELAVLDGGHELFRLQRRVGIRKVEAVRTTPSGKDTFYLKVNGRKVYIRGGNYMPADYLTGTGTDRENLRLLRLARDAGMNMLRLWGGGNNESEWFYSRCDEMGLMMWKEMHLHSHTYPDYDATFLAQARTEAEETIRYLRNHACFAVICGGNEQQEGWDAWHWKDTVDRFYGERLLYGIYPEIAAAWCPGTPYVPNSPHGRLYSQSPVDGDTHSWGNFYNATKDPQFVCETRWFSGAGPKMETLESYMGAEIWALNYRGWHKRFKELTGQDLMGYLQYGEYNDVSSLQSYLRCLELEQFLSDYHALYYLRSRSPSCNGFIYWPLNAGGPFMYLGAVDYGGRQLMSYYLLPRLYADHAIHIYRDGGDLRVMGSNAGEETLVATLRIRHYRGSRLLAEQETPVEILPCNNCRIHDLPDYYGGIGDRRSEAVHAALLGPDGAVLSEDIVYFCTWFEFRVDAAPPTVAVRALDGGKWELTVTGVAFAKLVDIDFGYTRAYLSDNYFPLLPGQVRRVTVELEDPAEAAAASFTVSSLDGDATGRIGLVT